MRFVVTILSLSLLFASNACAQKDEGQPESGPMPILSATNTIATCFMDHTNRVERRQICPGQYIEDCIRQRPDGETTYGMITCSREETDAWQTLLDRDLIALADLSLSPLMATSLEESQAAWLASREADCRYSASFYEGGTMAGIVSGGCYSDMTALRSLQVSAWLEELVPF